MTNSATNTVKYLKSRLEVLKRGVILSQIYTLENQARLQKFTY